MTSRSTSHEAAELSRRCPRCDEPMEAEINGGNDHHIFDDGSHEDGHHHPECCPVSDDTLEVQ